MRTDHHAISCLTVCDMPATKKSTEAVKGCMFLMKKRAHQSSTINKDRPMISAERVHEILKDCLYKEEELNPETPDEPPEEAIIAKGIQTIFAFHPERLENHREEVKEILEELPEAFRISKGGGWSFLNMTTTQENILQNRNSPEPWGEQAAAQELACLAIGLGLGEWIGVEMQEALPGGMPYFVYYDVEIPNEHKEEESR